MHLLTKYFVLIFLQSVTGTSTLIRKPRIIGGNNALESQVPWHAHIFMFNEKGEKFTCGGSLISNNVVLTAAHCIIGYKFYELIFGEDEYEEIVLVNSKQVIPHQNYSTTTFEYDIGIINLPISIDFSDDVHAISLPLLSETQMNYANKFAITCGWGRTSSKANSESHILKILTMELVNHQQCPVLYKTKICAIAHGNENICKGDSGGSLTYYDEDRGPVIIGVTSVVMKHCKEGLPALFTRVSLFLNWIKHHSNVQIC
ncbi:brachyurin-like [Chrysoperla carnea]|uniref:brachyurin-like n=1 Tax=Chrysoperla carnea TaxID=189513 RepID=UPI001D08C3EA|nr:brachyurin-like [Chrysoperla carnea]